MYVWEKIKTINRCSTITVIKMFTGTAKPIRIIGGPDNQRPDKWSSTVYKCSCKQCYVTYIYDMVCVTVFKIADPSGRAILRHKLLLAGIAGLTLAGGHVCLSLVCCQLEVSAMGWSLVQRSHTGCVVSLCVCVSVCVFFFNYIHLFCMLQYFTAILHEIVFSHYIIWLLTILFTSW
jgi:hypothetical protein